MLVYFIKILDLWIGHIPKLSLVGGRMSERHYSVRQTQNDPANRYLFKQLRDKSPVIFICYNGIITGKIQIINDYEIKLIKRKTPVSKLGILYMFKPDTANIVKSSISIDKAISSQRLTIPRMVENRVILPEKDIEDALNNKKTIGIALRNGHVFKGQIHSNGIFSLRLDIGDNKRIVIMKHSIYAFKVAKDGAKTLLGESQGQAVRP